MRNQHSFRSTVSPAVFPLWCLVFASAAGADTVRYKDGKIIDHEGAWLHGKKNARAGMMMPGDPVLGAAYQQEVAPKVAMDRGKVVDIDASLKTPAGEFTGCLKVQEENPLDQPECR